MTRTKEFKIDPEVLRLRKTSSRVSKALQEIRPLLSEIASAGYSIGVHGNRLFDREHFECTYPMEWQITYEKEIKISADPIVRWIAFNTGGIRWSDVKLLTSANEAMMKEAAKFGLNYGYVISRGNLLKRSFLSMARDDREFSEVEIVAASALFDAALSKLEDQITFSSRQLEVIQRMADDMTNDEIAQEIGISPETVRKHLAAAKKRIGVESTAALISYAAKNGMIA
jgi:DNA-binding CsgD family transcriptional regulator